MNLSIPFNISAQEIITLVQLLIDDIRPTSYKQPRDIEQSVEKIQGIIRRLEADKQLKETWRSNLVDLLSSYSPYYLYTEKSLLGQGSFWSELWKKVKVKVLPPVYHSQNLVELLHLLFNQKKDYKWVQKIPSKTWEALFQALELKTLYEQKEANRAVLIDSILHISTRITYLGADTDLLRKTHQKNKRESPFFLQHQLLLKYIDDFSKMPPNKDTSTLLAQLDDYMDACEAYVNELRINGKKTGISLHLTYISRRLIRQIERLRTLVKLLVPENNQQFYSYFTQLFQEILEYQEEKNNIRRFVGMSANLLAFEIVEHTAQKGEKYIAENIKEYAELLGRSMIGGFIIAFFACFKILLDQLPLTPLGEGLVFGLNYALCFVFVKLLGGMIATKQPAMTASNIAQTLDNFNDQSIEKVKHLIIRLSKSQFISFVGNLVLAFPMAIIIAQCYPYVFELDLLTAKKVAILQKDLYPIAGKAYFYAAIAGICLSLSGLIAGYVDNKVLFSEVPQRVEAHPLMRKILSIKKRKQFAKYLTKNTGALLGNISLGFMLGLTGYLGYLTGLSIDIRHIAFSAANFGFIFHAANFQLMPNIFLTLAAGVLGIGLINFLISFGMTFFVAFRSRSVNFSQSRKLLVALLLHFITRPWEFFLPTFPPASK